MEYCLIQYVGTMPTREAWVRDCTLGVAARDKTKDRVLLGRDLVFLVGKVELLANGSFSRDETRRGARRR